MWRSAVRTAARRAGLRIRTGEAQGLTPAVGGEVHPWAMTLEHYDAMRSLLGGFDAMGAVLVDTAAQQGKPDGA
jgi:hypothetical protein